jgi:pimeloyl-ACP methyl ester carboxylesterase
VSSDNGAAVVLRHGSSSTANDTLGHAAVLARHGYGVLVTDARGHARSGGRAMDFGWYGDRDIAAAVSFLATLPEVDAGRIAVVGLSMGGEEALGSAAAEPRIAAVVAEGATGRTDADKAWFADLYGFRGQIQLGLEWLGYTLTDLLTDASKPIPLGDAVRAAAPRPVLLIAGGRVPDEGHAAAYIQQHAPASVTVWVVPGAGHIQGLSVAPDEWERTVIGFLDAALAGP